MIKKYTILLFLSSMLIFESFGQHTIKVDIYMDDSLITNMDHRLVVRFKYKGSHDTIKVSGLNGQIVIPSLTKEIDFFDVRFDTYSCFMDYYAAEVEGKGNIFSTSRKDIQIRIDNYPFSSLTKERFPEIKKNQYSMIFGNANDNPTSERFGFFNAINKK